MDVHKQHDYQELLSASTSHGCDRTSLVRADATSWRPALPNHWEATPKLNTRPPKRHAASEAKFNLARAWANLDCYLDSSDEDNTEIETANPSDGIYKWNESGKARLLERVKGARAEEDDSSDEYREEEVKPLLRGKSKRGRSSSDEANNFRIVKRGRKQRVQRVSRKEMARLLDFVTQTIDWKEAARHINAGKSAISIEGGQRVRAAKESWGKIIAGPKPGLKRGSMTAETALRLSTHWEEVASKRILGK